MSNENTSASPVPEAPAETGATFSLPADDPRRTENRGGLEAAYPMTPDVPTIAEALADERGDNSPGGDDIGTTGADISAPKRGADDTGASGSGTSGSGQVSMSTTGMAAPDAGPPGAGPVEGSQSGATAPRVEMTDIGLMDVNTTDVSALAEPTGDSSD